MRKTPSNKTDFANFSLIIAFTAVTALTIYITPKVQPYIFLRYTFTSIFHLFIVGYAFTQMLFTEQNILDSTERIALSFGSSLALTPLTGLILNNISYGIGQDSSFALLTLLTISFSVLAMARKRKSALNISSHSQMTFDEAGLNLKNLLLPAFPFILAVCLRVYPFAVSGMPFSTDGWPFIKNAEILLENSPINLGDNTVFDGAANYWPGISLYGAVASSLTTLTPMRAMAFYLPIAGAITILIFYALVKGLLNNKVALMASLIFGTAYTHAFFTAGVTKETYANPIYMSLLLIFLNKKLSGKKSAIIAFTVFSATLVLTHHLTPVIAITIFTCITMTYILARVKGEGEAPAENAATLSSILLAAFILYFGLYAYKGFTFPTISELISAASYQIIFFAASAYITFKPYTYSKSKTLLNVFATAAIAALILTITSNVTVAPGFTSKVQRHVLPYILPYFITMPFITLGYTHIRRVKASTTPVFWLSTLLALQSYAVFTGSSALNAALWIRTPNFLYPPMAVLAASGLNQLCNVKSKRWLNIAGKVSTTIILAIIILVNCYSLYAAVSLQDKYLGYHWLYSLQEFKAGEWMAKHSNSSVAADMKIYYLAGTYFKLKVNVPEGYKYLAGESPSKPQMLFTYKQMFENGYVIGFHGADLPKNWTAKTYQMNHIYTNGIADLYKG